MIRLAIAVPLPDFLRLFGQIQGLEQLGVGLADGGDEEALFGIEKLRIPRSTIPAITHVDYSARIQTVHRETNPRYYALLDAFKKMTGCPVLVNTSFNVRGEPIVCTPEDAFRCFMGTEIEALAVGNCYLRKEEQAAACGLILSGGQNLTRSV